MFFSLNKKYINQDQQGKAAFSERNPKSPSNKNQRQETLEDSNKNRKGRKAEHGHDTLFLSNIYAQYNNNQIQKKD
jgi:hypothetical protein